MTYLLCSVQFKHLKIIVMHILLGTKVLGKEDTVFGVRDTIIQQVEKMI